MGDAGLYLQTDALHGTFNWGYQFLIKDGIHLHEVETRLGTVSIFSDPQFQLQPMDAWQPAQLAINMNILQWTWPKIGPVIAQWALSGGWQWTDGQGQSTSVGAGLDLSTAYLPWLHIQGQIQLVNTMEDGKLHSAVQLPVSTFSAGFQF